MLIAWALFGAGSIGVILLFCALFTNGVEWLGKKLKVSEGMVGSIFAGVGTALPETAIPFIAIIFGTGPEQVEVGVGAIIGAPFMLSTLTLPLLGGGLLLFSLLRKRKPVFSLNYRLVQTDLRFFLVAFGAAILSSLLRLPFFLNVLLAVFLIAWYAMYVRIVSMEEGKENVELASLYFLRPLARHASAPGYLPIACQISVGLGGIVLGAHVFVIAITEVARILDVPPLILSLLITPVATELPEKMNSLLWIYQKKDALAVGNITGAMVFQGTFPVAIGLIGTPWQLSQQVTVSALCALLSSAILYLLLKTRGKWRQSDLILMALFYLSYGLYLYFG